MMRRTRPRQGSASSSHGVSLLASCQEYALIEVALIEKAHGISWSILASLTFVFSSALLICFLFRLEAVHARGVVRFVAWLIRP